MLVHLGTTYELPALEQAQIQLLRGQRYLYSHMGSEIPVQSHEVTVTVLRGFISPYNDPVVQHGSGAVLSLLTKPQASVR